MAASSALLAGAPVCFAAPAAPDSGQLLNETAPRPALAPPAKPSVEGMPGAGATRSDGAQVEVAGWKLKGNTLFSSEQLLPLLADTVGRKLDLAGLDEAAGRIARHYHQAGYPLVLAVLPRQQISGGVIEITVIEGHVESAAMDPASTARLSDGLAADLLGRVPRGRVAEDASINRLALIANDLPGMSARVILKPGQEAGGTALLLKLDEARTWAAGAFVDTQGSYATGRNRLGVTGSLYNPAGRGDSLDLAVGQPDLRLAGLCPGPVRCRGSFGHQPVPPVLHAGGRLYGPG